MSGREAVATAADPVLSIIVPDAVALPIVGSLQVVIDGWLRPDWPNASALVGKSNSVGARLRIPRDLSALELQRVEVGAGVFGLVGSGKLAWGPRPRLKAIARGTRSCAQLSASLPPSVHRDRLEAYLSAQGRKSALSPADQPVANMAILEVSVDLDLTGSTDVSSVAM